MKKTALITSVFVLTALGLSACGGGSSSSGSEVEETPAGNNLPANFVGVYNGTISAEVKVTVGSLSESESNSEAIVITVSADGTIVFSIDDEEISIGVANDGSFAGNFDLNTFVEQCEGTVSVTGTVNGTIATGTVSGAGECEEGGIEGDAELEGTFSATK